jgi:general secretion pathway protein F
VRQLLRDKQLLPMEIQETAQKELKKSRARGFMRRGLSTLDLALLTRQLATLLHSGLPLEESLQAVAEQTEKPRVQRIVLGVRSKVVEGHPWPTACGIFRRRFPEIYRATVSAGEQSGQARFGAGAALGLHRVAPGHGPASQQCAGVPHRAAGPVLRHRVLPAGLRGAAGRRGVRIRPPGTADRHSHTHRHERPHPPLLVLRPDRHRAATWGFLRWLKAPEARLKFDRFLLRVPLLGKLIRGLNTARFSRTFSILTASAVPVLEALRISAEVVTNMPMKRAVEDAALRVREGAPIGKSLAARKLFPPMMIHLISSGESSGELEKMLERAATNQEREMDGLLSTMTNLLGPFMVVFMGAVVMFIVIALLLPIFQLNDLVK